jgi:transposase
MADSIPPFAALDVHANQSQAAVFEPLAGELRFRRIQGPPLTALEFLSELGPGVHAVYEAGPTGFGLARAAAARSIDLRVVSPGQIPKRPSDRVKTDRKDAERLVRLLAAGELRFAHVPPLEQERFRDLVRAIEDALKDQMRARHRLSKFLLRRDLRFPGSAENWTLEHLRWLARLDSTSARLRRRSPTISSPSRRSRNDARSSSRRSRSWSRRARTRRRSPACAASAASTR